MLEKEEAREAEAMAVCMLDASIEDLGKARSETGSCREELQNMNHNQSKDLRKVLC